MSEWLYKERFLLRLLGRTVDRGPRSAQHEYIRQHPRRTRRTLLWASSGRPAAVLGRAGRCRPSLWRGAVKCSVLERLCCCDRARHRLVLSAQSGISSITSVQLEETIRACGGRARQPGLDVTYDADVWSSLWLFDAADLSVNETHRLDFFNNFELIPFKTKDIQWLDYQICLFPCQHCWMNISSEYYSLGYSTELRFIVDWILQTKKTIRLIIIPIKHLIWNVRILYI